MIQSSCRCLVFTSNALQDEANARNEQLHENASSVRRGQVHVVACASSCGVCVFVWRVRLVCVKTSLLDYKCAFELNNVKTKYCLFLFIYIYIYIYIYTYIFLFLIFMFF